jgi:hypothetical protein
VAAAVISVVAVRPGLWNMGPDPCALSWPDHDQRGISR